MTTLHLAEGLESIGQSAFRRCPGIVDLYLPESLRSIGKLATVFFIGVEHLLSRFERVRAVVTILPEHGKFLAADPRDLAVEHSKGAKLLAHAGVNLEPWVDAGRRRNRRRGRRRSRRRSDRRHDVGLLQALGHVDARDLGQGLQLLDAEVLELVAVVVDVIPICNAVVVPVIELGERCTACSAAWIGIDRV